MDKIKKWDANKVFKKYFGLDTILIAALCFPIFFLEARDWIPADVAPHIKYLQKAIENNTFPIPPLYYFCIYILTLILGTQSILIIVTFLLTGSVLTKYKLTKYIVGKFYLTKFDEFQSPFLRKIIIVSLFSIIFVIPVYFEGNYYLGKISPNVWHNSTTIFLMPFALALHFFSLKYIKQPDVKTLWLILLFCILNILIKPSFFFVFGVIFPFTILIKWGWSRAFWQVVGILLIAAIVLGVEFYLIYQIGEIDKILYANEKTSIAVIPFNFWTGLNISFTTGFIASIAFPLVVIIGFWRDIKQDSTFLYTVSLFVFSIIIAIFITETGSRSSHGNFLWQAVICLYLLYLHSLGTLLNRISTENKLSVRSLIAIIVYLWSGISGLFYFGSIILNCNYN